MLVKAPDKPTPVSDIYEHLPPLCNGSVYVAKAEVYERRAAASQPLSVADVDAVLVRLEQVQPWQDARQAQYYKNKVGRLYFARQKCVQ